MTSNEEREALARIVAGVLWGCPRAQNITPIEVHYRVADAVLAHQAEAAVQPLATLNRLVAVIDTWRGPSNPATELLAPLFEIANEAKRALP